MDAQYAAAYPELYRRHWWWRVREAILIRTIADLRKGQGRARILDVGCGAGLFFDALEPFGHVEGIESDRTAIEQAGRWVSRIRVGQLDASYRTDAPFDLILLLDLLEHVSDPEAVLRRAGSLLAPDGRVLITVPAFEWLWTSHDVLNHHVRRYTVRQMRDLIARAGLATDESRYLFQSLVVPKLLLRIKEGVTAAAPRVPTIPARAINGAAQTWFRLEAALVGRLPFGSSVLAVARRPVTTPVP